MTDSRPESIFRDEILRFIAQPVYPYLVTTTRMGAPYLRPVICVNDDFQIRMITRLASRKVQHIRHNPLVSLFWSNTESSPPRSVMLQARVTLVTDPAAIDAFAADYRRKNPRRERALPSSADALDRVVLSAAPILLRADGFRGFRPLILREADLVAAVVATT
jgi:nitroimidazol reductase NimA-like FMN-containing flavoprotein (pyridoxamine 5'-phosphate oxidase superfamily)